MAGDPIQCFRRPPEEQKGSGGSARQEWSCAHLSGNTDLAIVLIGSD